MEIRSLFKNDIFEWIDIQEVRVEDVPVLSKQYNINILHLKDCINSNHLPKAEDLGETQFILARMSFQADRNFLNSINDISTKVGIFVRKNMIVLWIIF